MVSDEWSSMVDLNRLPQAYLAMREHDPALQAQPVSTAIDEAAQRALDHYDCRSELYTNDADAAAGMADILRDALSAMNKAPNSEDG